MNEELNLNLIFALIQSLAELFTRHANGEDVSADLDVLQKKIRGLKAYEQGIADGTITPSND